MKEIQILQGILILLNGLENAAKNRKSWLKSRTFASLRSAAPFIRILRAKRAKKLRLLPFFAEILLYLPDFPKRENAPQKTPYLGSPFFRIFPIWEAHPREKKNPGRGLDFYRGRDLVAPVGLPGPGPGKHQNFRFFRNFNKKFSNFFWIFEGYISPNCKYL